MPVRLTEFEMLVLELGITTRDELVSSPAVRNWVRKHVDNRYVPEWLLGEFGYGYSNIGDFF